MPPELNDVDPQDDSAPEADETGDSQQLAAPQTAATDKQALDGRKPLWTAADTQTAQVAAAVRRELGLPKNASEAKVVEAINALKQPAQVDYDNLDPQVQAKLADYEERLWTKNEEIYGGEVTATSRSLYDAALSERDPDKFAKMFVEAVLAVTEAPGDSSEEGEQPSAEPPMPTLGESDAPLVPRQGNDRTFGLANTGDMRGFVRGLFGTAKQ